MTDQTRYFTLDYYTEPVDDINFDVEPLFRKLM